MERDEFFSSFLLQKTNSICLKYCCPILAHVPVISRRLFWETRFYSFLYMKAQFPVCSINEGASSTPEFPACS